MSGNTPTTTFRDLPVDILYCIFPFLDVPEFLALTSTCKALHQPDLSQYAQYWSAATRSTFRVPNQPVVENDGARWQKMYKRLLTQSKVYTWGNNEKACLGHSHLTPAQMEAAPAALRNRLILRSRRVTRPTEMEKTSEIGIIADMQCGGWSTTLLSSKGVLYSVGVLDGLQIQHGRIPLAQRSHITPTKLRYPPGMPHPSERYDPVTAVKQFSSGRAHILALSDSGRIWSWQNIDHDPYTVKFLNIDLKEQADGEEAGCVKKVVAGWNKSSALIIGTGIVIWDPLSRALDAQDSEEDAALVLETLTVPLTAYRQPRVSSRSSGSGSAQGEHIGEIQNYICLEDYILFNTHHGKVFAVKISWISRGQTESSPVEIVLPTDSNAGGADRPFATDVQGSFRSFAIFTRSGAVYTGNLNMVNELMNNSNMIAPLKRIPALQNSGVISIAFGDYHFHALHAGGHITSYGTEPQSCGALGLGGQAVVEGRIRGLRYQGIASDAKFVPHAYTTGRRVWFEREKHAWVTFLTSGGADPEEARERMRMCQETNVQGEVSDWVEQEGRAWEEKYGLDKDKIHNDDGLGAYFALNVTAAGWHSGALVLVNEEMAATVRENCIVGSPPVPETTTDDEEEQQQQQQQPAVDNANSYAAMIRRFFQGTPADSTPVVRPVAEHRDPTNPRAFVHPINHCAAAEDGRPYAWANDPFPRLRLSDGREMPGRVEFSEWRYGRPEWDLTIEVD